MNTGLGAVFILGALAVLGGDSLTDFAVALLIGIAVGTYSSMFTASPIAIELQARRNAAPPRPTGKGPVTATPATHRATQTKPVRHRDPGDTGVRI